MRKIKFSLKGLSDAKTIQQCNKLNATVAADPSMKDAPIFLVDYTATITSAQAKLTASDDSGAASKDATAEKDAAMKVLRTKTTQIINYLEFFADGNEQVIVGLGLNTRKARTPATIPGTVMNVSAVAGDNGGRLDLHWDFVPGTKNYEIEYCLDPMTEQGWKSRPTVTKSRAVLAGLASGTRVWVRVRACNTAGQGAWSNPVSKIVP